MIRFIPSRPGVPVLRVVTRPSGYVLFQCVDSDDCVQVETEHGSLADALRQVAQRMHSEDAYRAVHYKDDPRIDWEVRV